MKSLYRMFGGLLVFFMGCIVVLIWGDVYDPWLYLVRSWVVLSLCLIVFCLCVFVERWLVDLLECWARRVADEQKGDPE